MDVILLIRKLKFLSVPHSMHLTEFQSSLYEIITMSNEYSFYV